MKYNITGNPTPSWKKCYIESMRSCFVQPSLKLSNREVGGWYQDISCQDATWEVPLVLLVRPINDQEALCTRHTSCLQAFSKRTTLATLINNNILFNIVSIFRCRVNQPYIFRIGLHWIMFQCGQDVSVWVGMSIYYDREVTDLINQIFCPSYSITSSKLFVHKALSRSWQVNGSSE